MLKIKKARGLHDRIIQEYKDRLANGPIPYQRYFQNFEYCVSFKDGEIDLGAYYKNKHGKTYALMFEIKCNDNHKNKALMQLEKDELFMKHYFHGVDKVYKFYVTKDKIEWIKKDTYNMTNDG